MRDLRVLIVGGGVGGMSTAIALRKLNHQVDLVDIDPNWRVYGAGITVTGPSLRAFKQLGILEDVMRVGSCTWATRFYTQQGELVGENSPPDTSDITKATGGIMRPALHKILSEKTLASGAHVRLGLTVENIKVSGSTSEVLFSDGSTGRYQLIVGADGAFSKVRQQILPNAPRPKFTGQGCWQLVAKRPSEMDYVEMYMGVKMKAGLNPVSATHMYMFLLEHVPDNPYIEDQDLAPRLSGLMSQFGGNIGAIANELTPESQINYRPLESVFLNAPWHRGNTLLIGDAAHATTPHLASGAGMAVEDGLVLADVLEAADSLDAAFAAFMKRRFERCRTVVETSVRIGELEMAGQGPQRLQSLMGSVGEVLRSQI